MKKKGDVSYKVVTLRFLLELLGGPQESVHVTKKFLESAKYLNKKSATKLGRIKAAEIREGFIDDLEETPLKTE